MPWSERGRSTVPLGVWDFAVPTRTFVPLTESWSLRGMEEEDSDGWRLNIGQGGRQPGSHAHDEQRTPRRSAADGVRTREVIWAGGVNSNQ